MVSAADRFHLKKLVRELEQHHGRHTELVTVYVPAGYELVKIIQHLAQEQGTASNIKSTATRKNVTDALERMIQHLKLFKGTPPNGLAVFSGNVAEREGQSDVRVWSVEPPAPMNQRLYRCDKEFVLDPLQDMAQDKSCYGLVVVDRRDATIAVLRGKSIIPLLKTHSETPGKFRAGGQSSARFARQRELAIKHHFKKVADYLMEQFLTMDGLKGIILGGPGPSKYDFAETGYITGDIKKKIIGIKDLSYTDEFGLQELVDKSQDILASEELADEKKVMTQFFEFLAKKPGMVSYGNALVRKHLESGTVDTLLLSEALADNEIEEFEAAAQKQGTTVKLISLDTREGAQLKDLGKVAALLRYEIGDYA